MVAGNARYGEFPVRVVEVEPPTYVACRWAGAVPGEELRAGNSTLVESTPTQEGDATRLRVVESGFAAPEAPEEVRDKALRDNAGGRREVLDASGKRVEQPST